MKHYIIPLTLFIGSCSYLNYNQVHLIVHDKPKMEYVITGQVICDDVSILTLPKEFSVVPPNFDYAGKQSVNKDVDLLIDYIDRLESQLKDLTKNYGCRKI